MVALTVLSPRPDCSKQHIDVHPMTSWSSGLQSQLSNRREPLHHSCQRVRKKYASRRPPVCQVVPACRTAPIPCRPGILRAPLSVPHDRAFSPVPAANHQCIGDVRNSNTTTERPEMKCRIYILMLASYPELIKSTKVILNMPCTQTTCQTDYECPRRQRLWHH